ncbi:MAG: glycosyltransferase family 2 protein [Lachnospiraceae bacterium]|nr:glycosyltransferase family 2 protein [Lachnospiraceae bacterium]
MNNKFSVVISAYNASDFIGKTLDSVRAQTYKDYEVVVVDDGSPIPMGPAIEAYQKQYPDFPLRYVWQENEGPAGARKKCAMEGQYEWLAFLDHDDLWYPNKLEVMNQAINEHPADIYYHDEDEVEEDGSGKKRISYRQLDAADPVEDLVINGNTLSTSATVIKRQFFLDADPYSAKARVGEDYECWIKLGVAGGTFYHVDQVLGQYVRMSTSLTMKSVDYMKASNERIVDFYDYLNPAKLSAEEIAALKDERRAFNEYLVGRFYHANKDYKTAREYYKKSLGMDKGNKKCHVANILAMLHVRV